MINAGGDVTLAGSQVKGKRVELDAENLNIESLQDKSSYHGKQMNVSGSVSANFETPLAKMVQLKVQNKLRIKMVICFIPIKMATQLLILKE